MDYEAIAKETIEQGLESDDSMQAFNNAYENINNFEELLSQYKILSCDLDMPMTKEVKSLGGGSIFLIIASCFFIAMLVIKYNISKCKERIKNIGVMFNHSRIAQ